MRFGRRRPSLKLGIPLLLVGVVMASIGWGYVSSRLVNNQPPPCFPQSCPELGYYAILAVVGFFVGFWGGVETLLGALVRSGLVQPQLTPTLPPVIGTTPEDEAILSMAREFHKQIRFPKRRPLESVGWSESQPWYFAHFKWQGLRKPSMLVLYTGLRGKLEVEDWRNLLHYYFLVFKPPTRLILLPFFGYFVGPFFALLVLAGGISYEFGRQVSILYAQLVATPLTIILLVRLFSVLRRAVLKQDTWVAETTGREILATLFEKIDKLQLPEIEFAKRRQGLALRLWPVPNITQRIENLHQVKVD